MAIGCRRTNIRSLVDSETLRTALIALRQGRHDWINLNTNDALLRAFLPIVRS